MSSNLFGKVVEQFGGGGRGEPSSASGNLVHKVQDAVTGQQHPPGSQASSEHEKYPSTTSHGFNPPYSQQRQSEYEHAQYPPQSGIVQGYYMQQQGYPQDGYSQRDHIGERGDGRRRDRDPLRYGGYGNHGYPGGYRSQHETQENRGAAAHEGQGFVGSNRYGRGSNEGHGNFGYGSNTNAETSRHDNQRYGGHGDQGYGASDNHGYGSHGDQGYGRRGNQGHRGSH